MSGRKGYKMVTKVFWYLEFCAWGAPSRLRPRPPSPTTGPPPQVTLPLGRVGVLFTTSRRPLGVAAAPGAYGSTDRRPLSMSTMLS